MVDYTLKNMASDWWRRVKAQAALEGLTIKEAIRIALNEWMKRKEN